MSQSRVERAPPQEDIRASYGAYTVDGTSVGLVFDPENDDAWIQSDLTMPISS